MQNVIVVGDILNFLVAYLKHLQRFAVFPPKATRPIGTFTIGKGRDTLATLMHSATIVSDWHVLRDNWAQFSFVLGGVSKERCRHRKYLRQLILALSAKTTPKHIVSFRLREEGKRQKRNSKRIHGEAAPPFRLVSKGVPKISGGPDRNC